MQAQEEGEREREEIQKRERELKKERETETPFCTQDIRIDPNKQLIRSFPVLFFPSSPSMTNEREEAFFVPIPSTFCHCSFLRVRHLSTMEGQ